MKILSTILLLACALWAQRSNVAVAPFVGDKNVSPEQLNFLTGKFAGELMRTQAYKVLDRGQMDFVLKEQGFQQSGVCNSSECQVQMGQLLGVDAIVGGNLVRFGRKYAFRAELIDVSSGQVLYSSEVEESGELEDVYASLCQRAALELAAHTRTPPSITPVVPADAIPAQPSRPLSAKRKVALALWGTALVGAGTGYYFNRQGDGYASDYDTAINAQNAADAKDAYDHTQSAQTNRNISYGVSAGGLLVGAVLWFWPE